MEKGSGSDEILFQGLGYLAEWMTFKKKEWSFRIWSGKRILSKSVSNTGTKERCFASLVCTLSNLRCELFRESFPPEASMDDYISLPSNYDKRLARSASWHFVIREEVGHEINP